MNCSADIQQALEEHCHEYEEAHDALDHHDHELSHSHGDYSFTDFDAFMTVFSVLVSVFIEFGNTMILLSIAKSARLRTIPNMYISSLAVADMLVGALLMANTICRLPFVGRDILDTDESACLILMSLLFVTVQASLLSSLLVACDRSVYIHLSIHYSKLMTKIRALKLIAIIWILSFIAGTIPLYTSHFTRELGCLPTHVFEIVYMIVVNPAIFFSISLAVATLYLSIVITAMRQSKKISQNIRPVNSTREPGGGISKRSWKIVKTLMLLFGLFFCCWSPLIILTALEYTVHVSHDILNMGVLLAIANSGLNFLVLGALNKDFRLQYARLLGLETMSCCVNNSVAPTEGDSIPTDLA